MKEQMEQRLAELKAEYEAGRKMLAELESKQANLQQTLLRISGAMQVLEELLASVVTGQADAKRDAGSATAPGEALPIAGSNSATVAFIGKSN